MGFIEKLNKFGKKIPVSQTSLYKKIAEAKQPLEAMGLKLKIKNDFDLFQYEVIYKGMLTQNNIENAYEIFLNQNYDLLDYLNYDEKQKMFNNDIIPILEAAPSFFDEDTQTRIYIPYLEAFVNKRYTYDYQILMLKQHRDYIKTYQVNENQPVELYGHVIYRTDFSSLQNVFEDQRHICFYYDELKALYIFKKENHELLNKILILDENSDAQVMLEDVQVIAYDIENYLYKECLEFLKEKHYICEKTYKKVLKTYK